MTQTDGATPRRTPRARSYLMCPPEHFTVQYAINPWMDPARPVDAARAMAQWRVLRETFTGLGHQVRTISPEPGLPDMVFAANGATVIGGKVLGARFRYPQRQPESAAYRRWFERSGFPPAVPPDCVNEGEGDIVFAGRSVIAGYGFRTDEAAAPQGWPGYSSAARGQRPAGRSAVLSPRHRALRRPGC